MKIIKIWNDSPSDRQVNEIARDLGMGNIAIIPTDTLYAICCDALDSKAIERICRLKRINPDKTNLSIICSDISMASEYARIDNKSFQLIKQNTPGAFTFLLKTSSALPKAFKGRKTVGVRIPENATCRKIVEALGHPLLTTSIEFEDEDHAISPGLIQENYNDAVEIFVEGDNGNIEPSTIIDCTENEPQIIREGKGELK